MGRDHLDTGGDDEGVWNSLRFRCLFFTRTAVALVVSVLAAIVVVKAVVLILRPKKLQLTVAPSNVYVQRYKIGGGDDEYIFRFYLEAKNPSERVFIYYSNITVGLFIDTPDNLIASFNLTPPSISLSQQEQQELVVYGYTLADDEEHVNRSLVDEKLFQKEGQKMTGAIMTLDGIITENTEGMVNKDRHATFDCGSIAVINSRELPQPQSDTHRWKCGLAIL